MKVLHIITGLGDGGAEGVLYRLCTQDKNNVHIVISLMGEGKYYHPLINSGIRVELLNQKKGRVSVHALFSLYKLIKDIKPNVVQTWMYHSDLIGGILAKLLKVKTIIWNIRHSTLEPDKTKKSTIFIAYICGKLSKFIPNKIICCAKSASEAHIEYGYESSKIVLIENGYELDDFRPRTPKTSSNLDSLIHVGMVGRYTPEKDHMNLLNAMKILDDNGYKISLTLAGKGMNDNNSILVDKINELGLASSISLIGTQSNIPKFMGSLDFHVLSSSSEGFPNVLAEAMACGIPCVTTDAGDASIIVGDTGWVVKIKNSNDLAISIMRAIDEMISAPDLWKKRKVAARTRIVDNYSIEVMIKKYNDVWLDRI